MRTIGPSFCSQVADVCLRLLGLIFLVLGVLKLHGIFYPEDTMWEYLGLSNPILSFLPNRAVLLGAALAEIGVGICNVSPKIALDARSSLLLWFSSTTLAYKVMLALVKYDGPCGCLFGINRFIPLNTSTQSLISDIIVIVTFLVSLPLLVYAWWSKRADSHRAFAEISSSPE